MEAKPLIPTRRRSADSEHYAKPTAVRLMTEPVNVDEYVRISAWKEGHAIYEQVNVLLMEAIQHREKKTNRADRKAATKEAGPAATGP